MITGDRLFKCPYGHVSAATCDPQTIENGTVDTVTCGVCGRVFEVLVNVDTFQLEGCQEIGGGWSGSLEFIKLDVALRDLMAKAEVLYPEGVVVMLNRQSKTLALFVARSDEMAYRTYKMAPQYWSTDIDRQWQAQHGEANPLQVSEAGDHGF